MKIEELNALRNEYSDRPLNESDAGDDPVALFRSWFDEAKRAELYEVNAMVLGTVNAEGLPATRMVLLKQLSDSGEFGFFTNYESRKAQEIEAQPRVSLLFYWDAIHRQVRIEGEARKVSAEESYDYFKTRPHEARIGAFSSPQSRELSGREELEQLLDSNRERFAEKEVPLPEHWGGYAVKPRYFEFWQGRRSRVHDRVCFERQADLWRRFRLAP